MLFDSAHGLEAAASGLPVTLLPVVGENARWPTVTLPRGEHPVSSQTIRRDIAAWVSSEPLRALISAFGGAPGEMSVAERLEYLDDFSAAHWDFRRGDERTAARRADFDPDTAGLILDAASALGLRRAIPPRHAEYTHVLVLGGMLRACLARTSFAAALLSGGLATADVTGLGGFRALASDEIDLAASLRMSDCRFEVDGMREGAQRAFGLAEPVQSDADGDPDVDPHRAWSVTTYRGDLPVHVVAAPSGEPETRRANTADTCRFWADRVAKLRPGDRVLVVTARVYVPFQHCDAIANIGLPYDCDVDTVGVDMSALDAPLRMYFAPEHHLQEIRSTVLSMRRLYIAASAGRGVRA